MDPYIGKVLNERYEIQSLIGQGSTSVVYKAHCRRLDRTVAIKILNEELSNDENLLTKFYEESSNVASLSQANIVEIFDINQHQNIHYIVMEYLDGISLKKFIEYKHFLTWNETIYFSVQILRALEYAHAHGVIHHDLKPQNVMILRDGSVKVTDFSIAHFSTSKSTMSRSQLDSIYYLSPEQANGSTVDTRSDLYSLGIMMYEMLTGRVPYSGTSTVSVAVQHMQGGAVPPRNIQPNIPIGLQQITMHAMNSDIRCRYNTAYGMKKDLETLQQNPRVGFRYKEPPAPSTLPVEKAATGNEQTELPQDAGLPAETTDTAANINIEAVTAEAQPDPAEHNVNPEETDGQEVPQNDSAEAEAGNPEAVPDSEEHTETSEEAVVSDAVTDQTDESTEEETVSVEPDADGVETGEFDFLFDAYDTAEPEYDSYNQEDSEAGDYDEDEDEADDEYEEPKHHGLVAVIIIVLILLILGGLGYYFRDVVIEYALTAWNLVTGFSHSL